MERFEQLHIAETQVFFIFNIIYFLFFYYFNEKGFSSKIKKINFKIVKIDENVEIL